MSELTVQKRPVFQATTIFQLAQYSTFFAYVNFINLKIDLNVYSKLYVT